MRRYTALQDTLVHAGQQLEVQKEYEEFKEYTNAEIRFFSGRRKIRGG